MKHADNALFTEMTIQSGLAHLQLRSFSAAEAILGRVAPDLIPFCNPKLYGEEILTVLRDTPLPARNEVNASLWDRIVEHEQVELTRKTIMTVIESRHEVLFEELPVTNENVIARAIMHHSLAKTVRMDQRSGRVLFCAYLGA